MSDSWRPPEPDPFVDLSDDVALQDAIAARAERRTRQDRAAEVATWIGTLRDLAERNLPMVVRTSEDRVHRGAIAAVGIDHIAVRLMNNTVVLVALDTIRSLRPEPGQSAPIATGDRARSQDRTLVEALSLLVEQRREVVVSLREVPDPLHGDIAGMGEDVVTIRLGGEDRGLIYLPVAAIREVIFSA